MLCISGCEYTSVGQEGEPGTQGKKIHRWTADRCRALCSFSYVSTAKNSNLQMEEKGKVEDEFCVLPGCSVSVLGGKMGKTEDNGKDFRQLETFMFIFWVWYADIWLQSPAVWLLWLLSHSVTLGNWSATCGWDAVAVQGSWTKEKDMLGAMSLQLVSWCGGDWIPETPAALLMVSSAWSSLVRRCFLQVLLLPPCGHSYFGSFKIKILRNASYPSSHPERAEIWGRQRRSGREGLHSPGWSKWESRDSGCSFSLALISFCHLWQIASPFCASVSAVLPTSKFCRAAIDRMTQQNWGVQPYYKLLRNASPYGEARRPGSLLCVARMTCCFQEVISSMT